MHSRITPRQFGGNPDCGHCGCMASAGLKAIGDHRALGVLAVNSIYSVSSRLGNAVKAVRGWLHRMRLTLSRATFSLANLIYLQECPLQFTIACASPRFKAISSMSHYGFIIFVLKSPSLGRSYGLSRSSRCRFRLNELFVKFSCRFRQCRASVVCSQTPINLFFPLDMKRRV